MKKKERIAQLEEKVAALEIGLSQAQERIKELEAHTNFVPIVTKPILHPTIWDNGCVHDFPSHQVGVVACSKCGMKAYPPVVTSISYGGAAR